MMNMRLIYLCIYIAEGITAWSYFSGLYKRKYALWINVAVHTASYGIAFLIFDIADSWINGSVFALINFALLHGCYICSWKAGIFHAGMLTCLSTGLEFAMIFVLSVIFNDFGLYQRNTSILAIIAVCSKLLYFLSTKLCLMIARKSNYSGTDAGPVSLLLSCFSIATICVMVVMFYTGLAAMISSMRRSWMAAGYSDCLQKSFCP